MSEHGFIKFARDNADFDTLVLKRPTAFVLLAIIARRAKRSTNHPDPELELGEALVGDYKSYGVTRRIYRTDQRCLKKWQFATFKATTKGTIAKLTNTNLFDINIQEDRPTDRPTNRPSRGHQKAKKRPLTKNVKNVKNRKEEEKNSLKSSHPNMDHLSDKDKAFLEIHELHQLDFSKLTPEEQTAAEDRAFELALIVTT